MTAQHPEILINDSDVDLGWLQPYFVRREDNTDAFPVAPRVSDSAKRCSALWRGFVAHMRLHSDYRLELERFEFPFSPDSPPQTCNAFFTGDFTITFRPFFTGPSTIIPFRAGCIVADSTQWQIGDQVFSGTVSSVIHNRHTREPIGLWVDIDGLAFAPKSLVPEEFRNDLKAIVGRSVFCEISQIDHDRAVIILAIKRMSED